MNDDVKAALARFHEWEFDGLDSRDLATLLAHIDGEPARTAAAVAAAREEQREACATRFNEQRRPERPLTKHEVNEAIRGTPLTATPLADELERSWQQTARMVERAEKAESEAEREKTEHAEALTRLDAWRMRAGAAEAERDALADSLAYAAGATVEQAKALHEKLAVGIRTERDALRRELENELANGPTAAEWLACAAERDALRAQVKAARALCASFSRGGGVLWPGEVLAAMDGAKP